MSSAVTKWKRHLCICFGTAPLPLAAGMKLCILRREIFQVMMRSASLSLFYPLIWHFKSLSCIVGVSGGGTAQRPWALARARWRGDSSDRQTYNGLKPVRFLLYPGKNNWVLFVTVHSPGWNNWPDGIHTTNIVYVILKKNSVYDAFANRSLLLPRLFVSQAASARPAAGLEP